MNNEIKNGLMNSLLKNILNEKEDDFIVKNGNILYQLTSSYNQRNKIYKNISSINLGECENILKEKYNINKNESLLIFKIEYLIEEFLIPIIKFEVFNPINKEQFNLDYCNNININIYTQVSINEKALFKYDPNSDYYNNICFPFTTDNGTDIVLIDRQKEYNNNNMSLCEKNCKFKEYDTKTKKVLCECNIENKSFLSLQNIINKEKLLNKFVDIKSNSNLLVMKCYNILFSKDGFFKNIGNYILISIILIYIISMILFYIKGYSLIYHKILNIIKLKNNKNVENDVVKNNPPLKIRNIQDTEQNSKSNDKPNSILNNKVDNDINDYSIKYIDYEINTFSYKEAVEKDKRAFFQLFISLIKTNHLLLFLFYPNEDYNSEIIKLCLFLFSFSLYYTINALFFTDSTMHKIYEDEGIFNFIYLLPKIIYSTLISSIIFSIIKNVSLFDKKIIKFKKKENIKECENDLPKLLQCLKIKFFCFFICSFIFIIFFWYYISCFCAVYRNTQLILFKDTIFSFGLSLLYPFIIFLISSIIRILSINRYEKFLELFYKMSKII